MNIENQSFSGDKVLEALREIANPSFNWNMVSYYHPEIRKHVSLTATWSMVDGNYDCELHCFFPLIKSLPFDASASTYGVFHKDDGIYAKHIEFAKKKAKELDLPLVIDNWYTKLPIRKPLLELAFEEGVRVFVLQDYADSRMAAGFSNVNLTNHQTLVQHLKETKPSELHIEFEEVA